MKKKVLALAAVSITTLAIITLFSSRTYADWEYCPTKFCDSGKGTCWVQTHCGNVGYPNNVNKAEKPSLPTE